MSESRFAEAMVSFDVFQIDLQAGELRREGRRIKIQEQPFRVLFLLMERAGEVVTREELREKLWPADTFVDFDHGLNSAVARLREALRDSADKPRFIETVAKRGCHADRSGAQRQSGSSQRHTAHAFSSGKDLDEHHLLFSSVLCAYNVGAVPAES